MKIIRNCLLMIFALFISVETIAMRMAYTLQSPAQRFVTAQQRELKKKKKCQNLICIFDALNDETVFGVSQAMALVFMEALKERVAPIIITANTVEHFCYWKTHPDEVSENFKTDTIFLAIITGTLFDKREWHCFAHKRSGLMLLVPKNYLKNHAAPEITDLNAQMAYCGFDVSNLDEITDLFSAAALQYIQEHNRGYENIIDDFQSMFIKNTDWLPYIPQWNIYVTGHGGHVDVTHYIPDFKKFDEMIRADENKVRELMADSADLVDSGYGYKISRLEMIENYQRRLKKWGQQRKDLELVTQQYGGIVPTEKRGLIAGLLYVDFEKLISFFEKGIKTSYLHYCSCYAGGSNQALVSKELSRINASFIVSTQGINEVRTPVVSYGVVGSKKPLMFTNFFTALQDFFCAPDVFIDKRRGGAARLLEKDPIAAIVSTIIDKTKIDINHPFVRVPGVGMFNALVIDKEVKLLTNSITRAHELEGAPIDYSDSSIKTVFVYPSFVGVPLKVNSHVAFVSPSPQEVKPTETIHIFEDIFYPRALSSVIANFVSFNSRYEPIIFAIKKLRCFDYANSGLGVGSKHFIDINDLIIYITTVKRFNVNNLDVTVNVMFRFNDINYWLSKTIKELQDSPSNTKELFAQLKSPVVPLNQEKLIALAIKILRREDVTIDITPSRIIQLLEEKIGEKPRVEKKGELKYALLLKKIDSLERAVTPEALNEQKAWLKKNNKPATTLVSSLKKLINTAGQLLQKINQLTVADLSSEVIVQSSEQTEANRNYLKERIAKAQEILHKEYELAAAQLTWPEYEATVIKPVIGEAQQTGTVRQIGEIDPLMTIRKRLAGKRR